MEIFYRVCFSLGMGMILTGMILAFGCAQPHRFDPSRQQQLQQQQDECMRRGGNPKECRP